MQVEGELHQFLIDSGASLSLVKPGASHTEIIPTDMAARGITGTKLKSLGVQEIEIKLGNRTYTHDFLVTPLDVEYSGVLSLDILRQMEAKVDLCSSGLITGRRRYELVGLNCQDLGSPQVIVTQPVTESEWDALDLINPAGSTVIETATGTQGAGEPASLVCEGLNPDSPANHKDAHNTLSIVSAQMVVLPPKSRVVPMGRMSKSVYVIFIHSKEPVKTTWRLLCYVLINCCVQNIQKLYLNVLVEGMLQNAFHIAF